MTTPIDTRKRSLDALAIGATRQLACDSAGVQLSALVEWLSDKDFAQAVTKSESLAKLRNLAQLQAAASKGNASAVVALGRRKGSDAPAGDDKRLTQTAYARHRGCSVGKVNEAVRAGRISKGSDGLIDVAEADAYWHTLSKVGSGRGVADDDNDGPIPQALAAGRLRRELAQADLAEMKAAEMRGELVAVAEMKAFLFDTSRIVREQLLAVPMQVAPLLAGQSDHEIRRILDGAIRQALADLPDDLPA